MRVVIVGSGIAGVHFAEKFHALSSGAAVTLVTRETDGYYARPLLSQGFSDDSIEQAIVLKTFAALRSTGIELLSGVNAVAIRRDDRHLVIQNGDGQQSLPYDRLILAQGSAAFIPPPFRPYSDCFFCLNSLADLKAMRRFRQAFVANKQRLPHWAVIGGGLIGCEVASDLAVAGDAVTLLHAMNRLMERQLVDEDSVLLQQVLQTAGVDVWLNQSVQGLSRQGEQIRVQTDNPVVCDALIVACGFKPNTELAAAAGLAVGRGIKVDTRLQTGDDAIYALGDVAELPNGKLYAFIAPIRHQAAWLAGHLAGVEGSATWTPPVFAAKAKVHGFVAAHPYCV